MREAVVPRGQQRGEKGSTRGAVLVRASQAGQKGGNTQNLSDLQNAVDALRASASGFAARYINDDLVRRQYVSSVEAFAKKIMSSVQEGQITPDQGMRMAQGMRNKIMEAARLRTSMLGDAVAKDLKPAGPTLESLQGKYASKLFDKTFSELAQQEKNQVALEIVRASERTNPAVTATARSLGRLGRGVIVVSLAVSVYNVAVADDKTKAVEKEGVAFGGGILGGAAGGAAAGLLFGPAAPVAVPIGAFIGGFLGALGAEITFDRLTGTHNPAR